MVAGNLDGPRVAIPVTDGVEPREALEGAGAKTSSVSPQDGRARAWNLTGWGDELPVDMPLAQSRSEDFDAVRLPGGIVDPAALRMKEGAVPFAQPFLDGGKPVATPCHAPWTPIETGRVKGGRLASWPSLRTDLEDAGAEWVDAEAVVDGNLASSRKPDDPPAFDRETIGSFDGLRARRAEKQAE